MPTGKHEHIKSYDLKQLKKNILNNELFGFVPGTSGSTRRTTSRLTLIWPATFSFNIILALSYIVLGTGPDCKPAPVP